MLWFLVYFFLNGYDFCKYLNFGVFSFHFQPLLTVQLFGRHFVIEEMLSGQRLIESLFSRQVTETLIQFLPGDVFMDSIAHCLLLSACYAGQDGNTALNHQIV